MTYKALRKDICDANQELHKNGLTFLGRGEVSGFDREHAIMVVKPAGIPHERLTPEDMLVVDFTGTRIEGTAAPGPDAITHLYLAQSFLEVNAIASSYSPHATMFAHALRPIPCLGSIHAAHFKGEIPVTRMLRKPELDRSYEKSLSSVIVERFGRMVHLETPAVLVASHGVVAWGKTAADAVFSGLAVEELARITLGTLQLAPAIQPIPSMLVDRSFADHGRK
ncbi:MAG: class II aldolase/adducin family protein [bacterium]